MLLVESHDRMIRSVYEFPSSTITINSNWTIRGLPLTIRPFVRYIRFLRKPPGQLDLSPQQLERLRLARYDESRSHAARASVVIDTQLGLVDSGNGDSSSIWNNVASLHHLHPKREDVEMLLPRLVNLAAQQIKPKSAYKKAVVAVGDLAYSANCLDLIPENVQFLYADLLAKRNPYRSIEIWRKYGSSVSPARGASYYLRAGYTEKAEDLMKGVEIVPPYIIRRFILTYCRSVNSVGIREATNRIENWIYRWQSPSPEDLTWIRRVLEAHNISSTVSVAPIRAVGGKTLRLMAAISTCIDRNPFVLQDDLTEELWETSVTDPTSANLLRIVERLCLHHRLSSVGRMIRNLNPEALIKLVPRMWPSQLTPSDYAVAIKNVPAGPELESILVAIPVDLLYTPALLIALGAAHPETLLELSVPTFMTDTNAHQDYLLQVYWRALAQTAHPRPDITWWLIPATLESIESQICLRAACAYCIRFNDRENLKKLLLTFTTRERLQVDQKVVAALEEVAETRVFDLQNMKKLGKPLKWVSDSDSETMSLNQATQIYDRLISIMDGRAETD